MFDFAVPNAYNFEPLKNSLNLFILIQLQVKLQLKFRLCPVTVFGSPLLFSVQRYATWHQRYRPLLAVTDRNRYLRYNKKKINVTLVTVRFGNSSERSVTVGNGVRR